MKTILVTGGAGYIGSAISEQLIALGHTVVIFDDLSSGREEKINTKAIFVQGDVTNDAQLDSVFSAYTFDAVIHCAAKKVMSESEQNPTKYFNNNVLGTLTILSCMERHSVPKIIFSSTAAVYAPVTDAHPVTEQDVVDPVSVYGRSKYMAEMLITEFGRLKKIQSYTILRYFNVAGDVGLLYTEPNPQSVFPLLALSFKNQTTFNIYGTDYNTKDGSAVRDYIHVYDLAAAHMLALENMGNSIFNLGTSNGYTVYELVTAFKAVSGKDLNVVLQKPRPGELPVMLADASKAKRELGWQPVKTLTDMVESTAVLYGLKE